MPKTIHFISILIPCPRRGSSYHENFKSLSRHSSPTEDREGGRCLEWNHIVKLKLSHWQPFPPFPPLEPSYPKDARRSWELRTLISQSKGELAGYEWDRLFFLFLNFGSCFLTLVSDIAARQSPLEAVRRSIRKLEEKRYAVMKQRNIIGQVCHTPKSYDNVMHVGLRKVTFKWQRGNKIGTTANWCLCYHVRWGNTDQVLNFCVFFWIRWRPVWEGIHLH